MNIAPLKVGDRSPRSYLSQMTGVMDDALADYAAMSCLLPTEFGVVLDFAQFCVAYAQHERWRSTYAHATGPDRTRSAEAEETCC